MPEFRIITGIRPHPREAADDAEQQARALVAQGWEQIGIAADNSAGSGGISPELAALVNNMANNIYQMTSCTCMWIPNADERKPGTRPPLLPGGGAGGAAGPLWVVYILLRHP